ncbi:hypothetical protein MTO96_045193 [Rhipicephalus appendiculatus]
MSSVYFKQLDAEARQRYRQKLMFEGLELPDPLDADVSLAPSTLLISSISDSEETDSSPETSEQGPVQAVNQQLATQLPVGGMYSGIDATAAKELRLSNERTSSQEWKTELTVADDMPNLPAKSCVSKPSRSLINTKINCWVWLRRVMDGGCQMDNICSNELNMAMDTSPV